MCRKFLFFSTRSEDVSIGSTGPGVSLSRTKNTGRPDEPGISSLCARGNPFPRILLISHIAEMQGEFANTLVIEMGTDNASRVREVE